MSRRFGGVFQIAYVVEDIDAAVEHWAHALGAGPFFVIRNARYAAAEYRGEEKVPDVSLAFGYSGDVNIELIQQHDDTPSVFLDFLRACGPGQQHVGIMSSDIDGDTEWLAARGVTMVQRLVNESGVETRFFDTELHGGAMLELIQASPEAAAAFSFMKAAADEWDGVDAFAPIPGAEA